MALRPSTAEHVRLCGCLAFSAQADGREPISDTYQIEVGVPFEFPRALPVVRETGSRIPPSFHTNADGELCLGSPLRLHLAIADNPTLPSFFQNCVIPYLYGFSYQEKYGLLPFGELDYGIEGILADYREFFRLDDSACAEMVRLGSLRKRDANREPCPCGSGVRLGKCHHIQLNSLRAQVGRPFLREQARILRAFAVVRQQASSKATRSAIQITPGEVSSRN